MSPERERIAPTPPVAATWKASSYRWGPHKGYGQPQTIEASPGASWGRVDVFKKFTSPASGAHATEDRGPHVWFLGLNEGLKNLSADRIKREGFDNVLLWFASKYGLLGLYNETFSAPILPSRVGLVAWVAPDAVLEKSGRLHTVDPATVGKECLEDLLHRRHGPSRRTGARRTLGSDSLVMPDELSFSSQRLTPFGLYDLVPGTAQSEALSWEEVRELYGVRAVLDEQAAWGVSIISTHEPLIFWEAEIEKFPVPPCTAEQLNAHAWVVEPHAISGEDGKLQRSWHCSSLLQAMYMMLFLDETGDDVEIRKCQAPNCPHFFRVMADDGRSLKSMYCPPSPGRKQSTCANRASSKMYRNRERNKS